MTTTSHSEPTGLDKQLANMQRTNNIHETVGKKGDDRKWVPVSYAALQLGISESGVRNAIYRGVIIDARCDYTGRQIILKEDVDNWNHVRGAPSRKDYREQIERLVAENDLLRQEIKFLREA